MPMTPMKMTPLEKLRSLNMARSTNGCSAVAQWTMNTHTPEIASPR